ncbi:MULTISPECIES: type II toxin-antitoxin system HicA family toxin [unclassified Frankia]|uniref:type II toxin-antitoxin system HicA family toxin n=1 Tax=unclassified Frankia TaxID=2632575 RepID=UPI002AD30505|nr:MULTISPECIES: type II toxin-antitoxin system HicA family toxin [unclassified Frankia]
MRAREVNRAIERAGGVFVRQVGSHRRYRATYLGTDGHAARAETAVPQHPGDIPTGTLARIEADMAPAFGKRWLRT